MGKIGIPDGINSGTSDGKNGIFENQQSITKVIFGSNCTFVGDDAFEKCASLSEINEDNVIEAIGTNAFAGTCISSANFDALTTLESGAFKECEKLESIIMPNVTSIPDDAFKGCKKLKDINLDNCTEIGNNAFEGCENIEQITLSKCGKIKDFAFINCVKLNRVYINMEEIIELGEYPFHIYDDSDGNSDVIDNINKNLLFFIPPKKFEDYQNSNYWKSYVNNMVPMVKDNQIMYKTGNNDKIDISDSDGVITYKHEYDYNKAFGLITFNDGAELKSLNDKMFKGNTNLTYINLPSKCERIGEYEFNECINLSNIKLPDNIKYIDDFAFANCAFKSFEIPETIEILGDGIFKGCKNIEKFKGQFATNDGKSVVCDGKLICVLPNYDKKQLNISDIDKNITKLGKSCLYGCENLIRVDIPSNITEIGDNAFEGCKNLREIHFRGDIPQNIGENIFGEIKDINKDIKIFVPETKFGEYWEKIQSNYLQYLRPMPENSMMIYYTKDGNAIITKDTKRTYNNSNGETITYYIVDDYPNTTTVPESFFRGTSVTEVILAENFNEVGTSAFIYCKLLEYVYLNKIKTLSSSCFSGCTSLTSITIPDSVTKIGSSAFYGCTSLTSVDISDLSAWCKISFGNGYSNPLYNGAKLYLNGSELTNITIPSNITEIKDYAFYNYTSLTNITIPNSVTDIGKDAFEGCASMRSVTIPNSVTSIGADAFLNCKELEYVKIASLSDWCKINFSNSGANPLSNNPIDNIKTILCDKNNFPITNGTISNVGEIKDYTFYNYTSLKRIKYANIERVGNFAFCGCNQLEEVVIDDEVTSIGIKAFYGCKNLKTFKMPEYVTSIGNAAFEGCTAIESITIPDSVTEIGYLAFMECAGKLIIKNKSIVENNASLGFIPFLKSSNFREISIGDNITKIGKNIFCGLESIRSVTIPNSVTSIDDSAFESCISMTSVTIGNGVTSIGAGVFAYCESLTSVIIPNSVTSIGQNAFFLCSSLISATIGKRVTSIGEEAFYNCTSLKSVYCRPTIPPQFVRDSRVFDNNASGRKIYVPLDSVNMYRIMWGSYKSYIEGYDFLPPNTEIWYTSINSNIITPHYKDVFGANIVSNIYEDGLGIITFDAPITSIGFSAFWNCANMTSVTIPNSVTSIGNGAFTLCRNLINVVIPDSVSSIGNNIFGSCNKLTAIYSKFTSGDNRCLIVDGVLNSFAPSGLTSYVIPNNVTSIGDDALKGYDNLIQITIPNNVTSIGNSSFYGCSGLSIVAIPNSVTSIDASAFANCNNLKSVTIGNSVTSIGQWAFTGCEKLTSVYCKPTIPPTGGYEMFEGSASVMKIYVPQNSVNAYKTANYWSEYIDSITMYNF